MLSFSSVRPRTQLAHWRSSYSRRGFTVVQKSSGRALAGDSGSGLIVLPEPTTNSASNLIVEPAARSRIPAIYAWEFQVAAGGLMSYGMDLAESFRGAAVYVDRILRGNLPADLPVQAPTKFKLVLRGHIQTHAVQQTQGGPVPSEPPSR
jgi:ABC-type uncharacterized transport system substrate-binding protein